MARPTLVSLARELGVSRQTVSNVLNAPHLVKPETRERVQAAIDASGYRPNVAAQALRNQRSLTVAMRIYPSSDGIYGAVMDRFLHRLVGECRTHGYNMMPITARDDADELEQLLALYERGSIDGCLLSGTSRKDVRPAGLVAREVPMAAFGRPWQGGEVVHDWVDVDGAGAIEELTRTVWAHGARRVGYVGFQEGSGPGDDRRAGWERTVQELAGPDAVGLQAAEPDEVEAGMAAAGRLLAAGADALVCASDSLAFGASEFLRRDDRAGALGVERVPVTGFDDSPVARAVGITSVAQPVEMAVVLLVHSLLAQFELESEQAEEREPEGILLPGEVQLRGPLA